MQKSVRHKNKIMKNLVFIFLLISFLSYSNSGEIMNTLKYVETINGEYTIGDDGLAFGILQIHKGCVDDVNRYHGTDYSHQDMFQEECAEEVFGLYMQMLDARFMNKYNRCPTEQDYVRSWNGGIYQGYKINATKKYYRKYLWWKNKLNKDSIN